MSTYIYAHLAHLTTLSLLIRLHVSTLHVVHTLSMSVGDGEELSSGFLRFSRAAQSFPDSCLHQGGRNSLSQRLWEASKLE